MNKLLQKIEDSITELNNQKKVIEKYPDIEESIDRWHTKRLSTGMVNSEVNDVMIIHNCGCCADSGLEAWPFKLEDGIRVYSSPAMFFIGEKNAYGSGENPSDNWQEGLRRANIAGIIIEKIQKYFDDNPPIEYEDGEGDEEI